MGSGRTIDIEILRVLSNFISYQEALGDDETQAHIDRQPRRALCSLPLTPSLSMEMLRTYRRIAARAHLAKLREFTPLLHGNWESSVPVVGSGPFVGPRPNARL